MKRNMLKGKISIHKYTGTKEGISIELEDTYSGIRLFSIDMSILDFGKVISGQGYVDCQFEIGRTDLAGKKRESKTEVIKLGHSPFGLKREEIEYILSEYEVNGWTGYIDDFKNHHNFGKDCVSVHFVRFVDRDGNPV